MHVTLFGVVLFLHIGVVIAAFMMAGVAHAALQSMARAGSVAEARPWARVMHRIEPLFPVSALIVAGFGVWLVHLGSGTDDAFSFKDGWIITAIVTLVAIEAIGGAILAPHGKRLNHLIFEAPDGPVTSEIREAAYSPKYWNAAHVSTFGFLGVVFVMASKPSGEWAWLFPVAGAVVGLLVSTAQLRRLPAAQGGTVPSQRAEADRPAA
jgi:hypothetical protein